MNDQERAVMLGKAALDQAKEMSKEIADMLAAYNKRLKAGGVDQRTRQVLVLELQRQIFGSNPQMDSDDGS